MKHGHADIYMSEHVCSINYVYITALTATLSSLTILNNPDIINVKQYSMHMFTSKILPE